MGKKKHERSLSETEAKAVARNIRVSPRATKVFASALTWVPLITLVSYIVVAVLFQARLNVLQYL